MRCAFCLCACLCRLVLGVHHVTLRSVVCRQLVGLCAHVGCCQGSPTLGTMQLLVVGGRPPRRRTYVITTIYFSHSIHKTLLPIAFIVHKAVYNKCAHTRRAHQRADDCVTIDRSLCCACIAIMYSPRDHHKPDTPCEVRNQQHKGTNQPCAVARRDFSPSTAPKPKKRNRICPPSINNGVAACVATREQGPVTVHRDV